MIKTKSKIIRYSLIVGFLIGIIGVSDCWYDTIFDIGDGGEGALGFLFLFGLPMSLLEFPLEIFDIVKGFITGLISLSILFIVNWCIIGYLIGKIFALIMNRKNNN